MAITYRLTTYGFQGRPAARPGARALMTGLLEGEPEDIERLADRVLCGERLALAGGLDKADGERLRKALAGVGIEAAYPESLSLLPVELRSTAGAHLPLPGLPPRAGSRSARARYLQVLRRDRQQVRRGARDQDVLDAERRKLEARISEAEAAEMSSSASEQLSACADGRKARRAAAQHHHMTKLRALLRSRCLRHSPAAVAVAITRRRRPLAVPRAISRRLRRPRSRPWHKIPGAVT